MQKIILGIHDDIETDRTYFRDMRKHFDAMSYAIFCSHMEEHHSFIFLEGSVIEHVIKACELTEEIIFLLDDISFPLSEESFTCSELTMIFNTPEFMEKTIFVYEGEIVDKEFAFYKFKPNSI